MTSDEAALKDAVARLNAAAQEYEQLAAKLRPAVAHAYDESELDAYERGYGNGYEEGHADGGAEDYDAGFAAGFKEGYEDGRGL